MAWVTKSERFNWEKETEEKEQPCPGPYPLPSSFKEEKRPCYAPFNSGSNGQGPLDAKKDTSLGLDPARYSPKAVPKGSFDHGLPKKHVPFTCGSQRFGDPKKDFRPGPGDYAAVKQTLAGSLGRASNKTMGVPPGEQRLLFKSSSAPSIPRDNQCYGYDEAGDGRLVRQGRKDGLQQLSGKPGDSAGPGQYDSHKVRAVANSASGGRIMPPGIDPASKPSETPGPGHYLLKGIAQSDKAVCSSFVSQTERGSKHDQKYAAEMPGPGQYARQSRRPNMRELHPELQYFGSTSERFKEDEATVVASKLPGPGQYGAPDFKGQGKSFAWLKGKRFKEERSEKLSQGPGPGAYYDPGQLWRHSSVSILGSTGGLAFGSMEARRGIADAKKAQEPGPGAYQNSEGEDSAPRKPRRVFPPSSFFRSTVPKDIMVSQYQRDGQVGPPPGAYSPRSLKELGEVRRHAPKNEGFGSASERSLGLQGFTSPGPGWYVVNDVTGGKVKGTFNRQAVEAAPASGKPRGLGFESQTKRFVRGRGEEMPGPGTYTTRKDSDWITKTHNIYFGDFA
ncbi:unnamed protein product [Effrenium voratum]|nr:unnamed protein product [Effrenium voratum]